MVLCGDERIRYNTFIFLKPGHFVKKQVGIGDGLYGEFYLSIADVV